MQYKLEHVIINIIKTQRNKLYHDLLLTHQIKLYIVFSLVQY